MQAGGMSLWKQMQRFSECQAPQTCHEDSSRFFFFLHCYSLFTGESDHDEGRTRVTVPGCYVESPTRLDDCHFLTCWEGTQSPKVLSSPVEPSNLIPRSRFPTAPSIARLVARLVTQGAAVGVLGMIFSQHGPSFVLGYLHLPPARPNSSPLETGREDRMG